MIPGNYELEWIFSKDFITQAGEDKAKLRNIKITNVVDVSLSCEKCPPGSFSGIGSSNCTLCAAGTYNPIEGASKCLDCPPLEDSFPGAIKCRVKAPGKKKKIEELNFLKLVNHMIIMQLFQIVNKIKDKKFINGLNQFYVIKHM